MKINLAKALYMKNRLVGELNELRQRLPRNSRWEVDASGNRLQQGTHIFSVLLKDFDAKTNELIRLKDEIARANVPVNKLIFEMSEIKTKISLIAEFDSRNQVEKDWTRAAGEMVQVDKYFAIGMTPIEKDDEVTRLRRRIDEIQEILDAHNASTFIEL